jgi:hypothetical protein
MPSKTKEKNAAIAAGTALPRIPLRESEHESQYLIVRTAPKKVSAERPQLQTTRSTTDVEIDPKSRKYASRERSVH